jgi:3-hydroxymyristoyl/3-hydroxydecanoyl-(acyl carrier protein) dehydratase
VMPGVEIVEAAGQAGAYALMMERPGEVGVLLGGIEKFEFIDMVLAGETITSETVITDRDGDTFRGTAVVKVDGREVAHGEVYGTLTKAKTIEKGPEILRRRREREKAEAIAAGKDPHRALEQHS